VPAALPSPATVWVRGSGDGRIATMAWRAAPGQPVLEHSDLSVLLMAVPGEAEEGFLEKALPEGTRLEPVSIDGDRGWWISGAVHELLYRRPDGLDDLLRTRLVGDTLVFSRDGTLYRFESALGREATIAIARTLHRSAVRTRGAFGVHAATDRGGPSMPDAHAAGAANRRTSARSPRAGHPFRP